MKLLRAEPFQAVGAAHLGRGKAIVPTHLAFIARRADAHADMAEPVELGADLTDLVERNSSFHMMPFAPNGPPVGVPGIRARICGPRTAACRRCRDDRAYRPYQS